MDYAKITELISYYRPLPAMSSLPFAVQKGDEVRLCWFNFYGDEHETSATVKIAEILTDDTVGQGERQKVSITMEIFPASRADTELDEVGYFLELNDLMTSYNKEKMEQLLTRAEISSLLPAYKAVMEMIK